MLAISILLVQIILIFIFRKQLRSPRVDLQIRIILSIVAFTLETAFHLSNLFYNTHFILRLIPLDLCSIALFIALILNITKKPLWFTILFFWGVGAIASFIYPDINGIGPDKLRYYHFFGVHAYIILTVVYFAIVHGYKIKFKHFVRSTSILFVVAFFVRLIDLGFYAQYKTNFMFLVASPEGVHTILDALPQGGWAYFFSFTAMAIFIMFVVYLPWCAANWYQGLKKHELSLNMGEKTI